MHHFTSVQDVPDVQNLVQLAHNIKQNPLDRQELGRGKTLALFFFNPSLRTRISTEKAGSNLGMNIFSMDAGQSWKLEFQDGAVMRGDRPEHVREAAKVISQYAHIIGIRSFPTLKDREQDYSEKILQSFCEHATVPVVSLESSVRHPLQSLADLLTIREYAPSGRPRIVLSWAPHPRALPQAVANSFLEWMRAAGHEVTITHPRGCELAPEFTGDFPIEYDQEKALEGADFVYVKNWSSYRDYGRTVLDHDHWMITEDKIARTNEGYFMHCLPVRRNVVVSDGVLDSPQSLVISQAGNRTWATQAVLQAILEKR